MTRGSDSKVQSVDRALSLLLTLGRGQGGLRLTDLSRATGLSMTTVHRLLTTLEMREFVHFSAASNQWHVGSAAFAVGSAFEHHSNFAPSVYPHLRKLRDLTKETANLGLVEDGEIMVLGQAAGREISRSITPMGGRAPMYASAMGKSILASYSLSDLHDLLTRHPPVRLTGKTKTQEQLLVDLMQTESRGYSVDDEENTSGVRCVAAPLRNGQRETIGAISVSGTKARLCDARIEQIGDLVAQAASQLSALLAQKSIPAWNGVVRALSPCLHRKHSQS